MASPSSSATMANSEAALSTQPALEECDQHQTVEEDTGEKAPVPLMLHVLEVEPGADIVQCLHGILESLQVEELFVISATGTVFDVTISTAGSVTNFPGIFHILSLFGSYFPTENPLTLIACREKVIAGTVHGILRAASPVFIVTGTYANPPVNIVTGTYADPVGETVTIQCAIILRPLHRLHPWILLLTIPRPLMLIASLIMMILRMLHCPLLRITSLIMTLPSMVLE